VLTRVRLSESYGPHGRRCRVFDNPATGIACLQGDQPFLARTGTTWECRQSAIPRGFQPSVIALDGPLLPQGADKQIRRHCESLFIRSPFHNRWKPGLSHWGRGLELRRATAEASAQFCRILASFTNGSEELSVFRGGPIVEAFPNAFLGVLMPEDELVSAPKLRRGRRFDWLYEQVVTTGRLETALSKRMELPSEVWRRLRSERDHELRAALICLLTAALAATGTAAVVGEPTGGWFWLPPWSVWQPWAKQGFDRVAGTMALKGQVLDASPSYLRT
jgi:hypothetical protein